MRLKRRVKWWGKSNPSRRDHLAVDEGGQDAQKALTVLNNIETKEIPKAGEAFGIFSESLRSLGVYSGVYTTNWYVLFTSTASVGFTMIPLRATASVPN